jgi:hypothetical protein
LPVKGWIDHGEILLIRKIEEVHLHLPTRLPIENFCIPGNLGGDLQRTAQVRFLLAGTTVTASNVPVGYDPIALTPITKEPHPKTCVSPSHEKVLVAPHHLDCRICRLPFFHCRVRSLRSSTWVHAP